MPSRSFVDPDPFAELTFATPLKARMAIEEELRLPLGSFGEDDRAFIDALLVNVGKRQVGWGLAIGFMGQRYWLADMEW